MTFARDCKLQKITTALLLIFLVCIIPFTHGQTASDLISLSYNYSHKTYNPNESRIPVHHPLPSSVNVKLLKISVLQEYLPSTIEGIKNLFQECNFVSETQSICANTETIYEYNFLYDHSISNQDITAERSSVYTTTLVHTGPSQQVTLDLEIHSPFSFQNEKELIIYKLEIAPTTISQPEHLETESFIAIQNIALKGQLESNANFNYFFSSFLYPVDSKSLSQCSKPLDMQFENDQIIFCLDLTNESTSGIDLTIETLQQKLPKDSATSNYSSSLQSFYIYNNYKIDTENEPNSSTNSGSLSLTFLFILGFLHILRKEVSQIKVTPF